MDDDDDIFPETPRNSGLIDPRATVSQDLAAREFAERYGGRMAFCHDHGKWFEYDGNIWRMCRTPVAFQYIRELSRQLSASAPGGAKLQEARFSSAVETFAKADPVFRRTADYWDSDPFLLGTPTGTVDLSTGRLRLSMQSDNITKATAVAPDEFEDCMLWHRFLEEATGGDEGMQRFLQQIAGYALTGDISEQSLFFIHGPGGAGKGVFINTLKHIMADYAKTAGMEAFAARKSSGHPTDLAGLRGARLVTASETEDGAAWDEARIKQLTGGEAISARFMRQDFFEYMPQFTLLIIGNHQPALRTVDEAMRRRFNIIPFVRIPTKPDTHLERKLRLEWPGILRWMINGCTDWLENGLVRPQSVLDATEDYFDEQNTIQQWIERDCHTELGNYYLQESTSALFESWSKFAKASGIAPGSAKSFKPALQRLGYNYHRSPSIGRCFQQITLRHPGILD